MLHALNARIMTMHAVALAQVLRDAGCADGTDARNLDARGRELARRQAGIHVRLGDATWEAVYVLLDADTPAPCSLCGEPDRPGGHPECAEQVRAADTAVRASYRVRVSPR
jgi:hypothetical protein